MQARPAKVTAQAATGRYGIVRAGTDAPDRMKRERIEGETDRGGGYHAYMIASKCASREPFRLVNQCFNWRFVVCDFRTRMQARAIVRKIARLQRVGPERFRFPLCFQPIILRCQFAFRGRDFCTPPGRRFRLPFRPPAPGFTSVIPPPQPHTPFKLILQPFPRVYVFGGRLIWFKL